MVSSARADIVMMIMATMGSTRSACVLSPAAAATSFAAAPPRTSPLSTINQRHIAIDRKIEFCAFVCVLFTATGASEWVVT